MLDHVAVPHSIQHITLKHHDAPLMYISANYPHIYTLIPPIPPQTPSHHPHSSPPPLRSHVAAPYHVLHWLTPFGLACLNCLSSHLPPELLAWEHVVMSRSVHPKTLSNYSAGILRFTQFCDTFHIPEDLRMPAPEWLLSIFITTCGASSVGGVAGSVGGSAIKTWLLRLQFWHLINGAPLSGTAHLNRAAKGLHALA